jgi:hypothetical protein
MKKALFIALSIFMLGTNVKAQNGTKYFSLKGGYFFKDAFSATLSYDWNTKYFKQNEIFAEYYQKFKGFENKSVMGGFVMKPVLMRDRNTIVRVRMGVGAGSDTKKFIVAPQLGFEFSQSLGKGFDFLLVNRNQYILLNKSPEPWRVGFEAGIRIPIN